MFRRETISFFGKLQNYGKLLFFGSNGGPGLQHLRISNSFKIWGDPVPIGLVPSQIPKKDKILRGFLRINVWPTSGNSWKRSLPTKTQSNPEIFHRPIPHVLSNSPSMSTRYKVQRKIEKQNKTHTKKSVRWSLSINRFLSIRQLLGPIPIHFVQCSLPYLNWKDTKILSRTVSRFYSYTYCDINLWKYNWKIN